VPTVNRRTFLQSTGLAATNAAVGTGRAGAEEENPFLSIALAVSVSLLSITDAISAELNRYPRFRTRKLRTLYSSVPDITGYGLYCYRSLPLASAVRVLIPLAPRSDWRERSREGIQRPHELLARSSAHLLPRRANRVVRCSPRFRWCSSVVRNGEAVSASRESVALSNDDRKRAPSVVAECRIGRSGTLRTTREGKSPAESGTAVSTSDASSDAETGSPVLTKRGAGSPERGRAG